MRRLISKLRWYFARLLGLSWSWRRTKLRVQVARLARRHSATVRLQIGKGVQLEGSVQLEIHDRARATIVLEDHVRLGDRVQIQLQDGGSLRVGTGTYIRRDGVLVVGGDLDVGPHCLVSWNCYLLCNERLVLEEGVGLAQGVTVVDSRHFAIDDSNYWRDNIETEPVRVGRDSFIGPGSTLLPGTTLASRMVAGAGAVIAGQFPTTGLILGVPGRWRELPSHLQRYSKDQTDA